MHTIEKAQSKSLKPSYSFTVFSRLDGRHALAKNSGREFGRKNQHGDTYKQNTAGQVTFFQYGTSGKSYTFGYDRNGAIRTINSSDGWSWTRIDEPEFAGWLVRNYFDTWRVPATQCQSVTVTEEGVQVAGKGHMALPTRA